MKVEGWRWKVEVKGLLAIAVLVPLLASAAGEVPTLSLSRLSIRVAPEIRSTYVSLGKIVEDRPMQITNLRLAYDLGAFGRVGIRNFDVSSLTERRTEAHRHALYHSEFGPTWEYDWNFAEDWKLHNDLTTSWTIYDGFYTDGGNKCYWWWQLEQSVDNPYVTPFWKMRRCVAGNDYFYCRLGLRRRFTFGDGFYLTPELVIDGGSDRNQNRVFGRDRNGNSVGTGFYSISPRLELGWAVASWCTVFAFVEQYEVMGHARTVNARSSYACAHNDWTVGGLGFRFRF